MSFTKTTISALVGIGSLFLASSASASTIIPPAALSITADTNWATNATLKLLPSDTSPIDSTPSESALIFSKFDSSLGTLTDVQFSFSGAVGGTLIIKGGTTGGTFTVLEARASILFDIFNDGTAEYGNNAEDIILTGNFGDPTITLAINEQQTLFPTGTFASIDKQASDLGFLLSDFSGASTDTFSIGCGAVSFQTNSASGSGSAEFEGNATCTAAVQYTYTTPPTTTVPEPATLALLGLGLAGLGMRRRAK